MKLTYNQLVLKLLLTLLAIHLTSYDGGAPPFAHAKRAKCVNQLKGGDVDFYFCSKFAVAKYKKLHAWMAAQLTESQVQIAQEMNPGKKTIEIVVAVYNHQQWQRVLQVEGTDQEACKAKMDIANDYERVNVPLSGSVESKLLSTTHVHKAGPQMYYVAVMDCNREMSVLSDQSLEYAKLQVRTHITEMDPDTKQHNEFSYEKQGIVSIDVFLILVYIVVFALNYQDWSNFQRRHDVWNSPHIYCLGAMIFQLISIIIDLQSNILFQKSGWEHTLLDVLTQAFAMINECTMILLLLMIANGWMTKWTKYNMDDMVWYMPIFGFVLFIHICFASLAFIDRDAYHKYHDFQGWAGFGLIMAKFILVAIYFYYYTNTKSKIASSSIPFYEQIIQVGLVYMLSDPILLLGTYLLSEWNMAFYYNIADQLAHLLLQCYFLYQMRDGRSAFTKSVDNFSTLPIDRKNK